MGVGTGLDGDEAVDVAGRTLLPGLFDCHAHVMFGHVDVWRLRQRAVLVPLLPARSTNLGGDARRRDHHGPRRRRRRPRASSRPSPTGWSAGPRLQICDHDAQPDRRPRRRLVPVGRTRAGLRAARIPGEPSGIVDGPTRCAARSASSSGRAPTDQGGHLRRRAVTARRPAPRALPATPSWRCSSRRRTRRRDPGHGPRPGRAGDQGGDPGRDPLDRARDLPRRRGDRADARTRDIPRARRSWRRWASSRRPRPARRSRRRSSTRPATVLEIHRAAFRRARRRRGAGSRWAPTAA